MSRILALWAVPRSTSTAFEWMMRMRGDMTCFHEPFGEAWYQGEEPLWPRVRPDSVRTPGLTLDSVRAGLFAAARAGPVFIKEFPLYLDHYWDDEFLSHFNHSFLIRHPLKTISSLQRGWPEVHPKELGFAEQRKLFDRLSDEAGVPPLMDSDDLLERPEEMVERYCEAVGIPFLPEALHWQPGARDEVSWWDGGAFHRTLRDSDGLKPQPRRQIDHDSAPDSVKRLCELALPHYEHMHRHRLRTASAGQGASGRAKASA